MTTKAPHRSTMSEARLRRLAGLALILALPLQVAGFLLHPPGEELDHVLHGWYGPAHTMLFVSWVLVALGLPSLYGAQAARAGRLGLVAYVATIAAVAYHLYLTLYEAFAIPAVAALPGAGSRIGEGGTLAHGAGALGPVAGALLVAFPLLGVATLRAGVLPRASGWLQVACLPTFVALMLGIGLLSGGAVGPEASGWLGGMLPIASLYWVLAAGYAVGGRWLWTAPAGRTASEPAAVVLA